MTKRILATEKAPAALGPYSQGVAASGEMIFVSGQIPIDPATGAPVEGDIARQTTQCMDNIIAILAEAGATAENIVKTTIYLKDMDNFGTVNEAYGKYFKGDAPARGCVEVARLPKDMQVEIEAIAVL
ncbi:MAG: RidA family protein [Peptococcaceae bacterium]|nr:RidA family protein [Peptococcaceae bacterium]